MFVGLCLEKKGKKEHRIMDFYSKCSLAVDGLLMRWFSPFFNVFTSRSAIFTPCCAASSFLPPCNIQKKETTHKQRVGNDKQFPAHGRVRLTSYNGVIKGFRRAVRQHCSSSTEPHQLPSIANDVLSERQLLYI